MTGMTWEASSQPRVLHCDCGEIREVSVGIAVLACVRCGRAMHAPRPPEPPVPSHVIIATASILVELLCAIAFILGAVWMLRAGDTSPRAIAVPAIAAIGLAAGALAYRGGVVSLIVGSTITAAIAILCSLQTAAVGELFLRAHLAPTLGGPSRLATVTAGIALITLGICVAALPQARKFAAWQRVRLERAFALPN
jgi:hypothetical protein